MKNKRTPVHHHVFDCSCSENGSPHVPTKSCQVQTNSEEHGDVSQLVEVLASLANNLEHFEDEFDDHEDEEEDLCQECDEASSSSVSVQEDDVNEVRDANDSCRAELQADDDEVEEVGVCIPNVEFNKDCFSVFVDPVARPSSRNPFHRLL